MLFQDPFQNFTVWDFVESGLYFMIVGFFILLCFYFLFIRFRTSKKIYWLYFGLFFICFGIGRVFFIVYDFLAPELTGVSNVEMVALLMMYYRLATFFTWLGTACAVGVLGILLFPPDTQSEEQEGKTKSIKKWLKIKNNQKIIVRAVLIAIPVVIGILALTLSDELFMDPDFQKPPPDGYSSTVNLITIQFGSWTYPIGRFFLNFIFMPLFLALIPVMFIYLAKKTFGVLRKSYAWNAIGFLLYYAGRILKGALDVAEFPHFRAILPTLIILLALLILVIANNYEQLK